MLDGLYSGAAAMQMLTHQQEVVSANLMNLNTVGHKKLYNGVTQIFPDPDAISRIDRFGPQVNQTKVDFTQGPTDPTGRPLDVAVHGDGFLVVDTPNGERFTRDGRLYRDPESGNLVNVAGDPVQGDGGPISIPESVGDSAIVIDQQGNISAGTEQFGQLRVVGFEDPTTLVNQGNSLFSESDDSVQTEADYRIRQGELEKSNVNAVSELMVLIVSSRQYEAVQKATTGISESLREHIRT